MTDLTFDQLLDVTECVVPLIKPETLAGLEALTLFESVVVTVAYLRQNATEDFLGAIFDVSQSTVSRRRTLLEGPVRTALEDLIPDPVEATKGDTVLVDGTLITTSDWSDQDDLFSGKHHRTGINVQVACSTGGTLLALGNPIHGSRHDAHAYSASGLADRLAGCEVIADLGYVGVAGIMTGTRRPPGGQLTDRQRTANQSLSGVRSVIEQTIGHIKNWKVLRTGYRGPLATFDRTLRCVEALHHLKASHRRHPAP